MVIDKSLKDLKVSFCHTSACCAYRMRYCDNRSVCLSVHLSVCLSATLWYCVLKQTHISSHYFALSDRVVTLSFLSTTAITKFQGKLPQPGWEKYICTYTYMMWEKFAIVDQNGPLFQKLYEKGSWLLCVTNRKS